MTEIKKRLIKLVALPMVGIGVVLIIVSQLPFGKSFQETESTTINEEQTDKLLQVLNEKYPYNVIASWDPATLQVELQKEADRVFGKESGIKIIIRENKIGKPVVERLSR